MKTNKGNNNICVNITDKMIYVFVSFTNAIIGLKYGWAFTVLKACAGLSWGKAHNCISSVKWMATLKCKPPALSCDISARAAT